MLIILTVDLYFLVLFLLTFYLVWESLRIALEEFYGLIELEQESEYEDEEEEEELESEDENVEEEELEDYADENLIISPRDSINSPTSGEEADIDDNYEEQEVEEEVEEDDFEEEEALIPLVNVTIGDGSTEEMMNRNGINGLFCPICFEAWTSSGSHQICCLPCGHIYGFSCIKKWLQTSWKCPQCNGWSTLPDVRLLYAAWLCVDDEEIHKRVRLLEAKCADLEQKGETATAEELIDQICSNGTLVEQLARAIAELHQGLVSPP